jgi:hypothetical protein
LRDLELALESADKMIVTRDMYERKATMAGWPTRSLPCPAGSAPSRKFPKSSPTGCSISRKNRA